MMPKKIKTNVFGFLTLLVAIVIAVPASADVVLSVDASGGTNVDLGTSAGQLIQVFISSDSADELAGITGEFSIEAGVVESVTVSATGAGTAGFFGAGNLLASDRVITGATTFIIDQEFNSPQTLNDGASREKWFELGINTNGLAPGTYFLQLQTPAGTFFDSVGGFYNANNNLTFTVSAVPEPGSLGMFGVAALVCATRRRRG